MRFYTFFSKHGHIPETVFSLEAATAVAKEWAKRLKWDVLVMSYEQTEHINTLQILQEGKARSEGVVDSSHYEFFESDNKGRIRKNGSTWAYILNRNLSPSPYLVG